MDPRLCPEYLLLLLEHKPLQHGATELRIAVDLELELQMTSVKVREPATTPTLRENPTDGVNAERNSAPCTVAEGELSMAP